ncbi:MAG: sulfatase-like hydrolase/transferase [Pirellulales bacterium]
MWLIVEDMSARFHCYGESTIETPNVDTLAARGTRFTRAFVTAPICSISRSALITGRYQTSVGAQNHRSNRSGHEIQLPDGVKLVPQLFRKAGYHVNNLTVDVFCKTRSQIEKNKKVSVAKTDYNFVWDTKSTYDANHWEVRESGKPFFVQVQLHGGKYRGQAPKPEWPKRVADELGSVTDPARVQLPPYLPDDPTIRADWAQYLDTVRYTDMEVGKVINRLREAGELDRTVVFFITDHGISHVRNKQFLYDGGIHIPMIAAGPGIAASAERNDLVEHIDLAAASLAKAGIAIPDWMFSRDILSKDYRPREFVFAARDRADETVDLLRSVRSEGMKYIRNGFPSRPYLQPNQYKDTKAIVEAMRRLHAEGKLNAAQSLIMAESRPLEELYDLTRDPFELHNLAAEASMEKDLQRMRQALSDWQLRTDDPAEPESAEVYDAEIVHPQGDKGADTKTDVYRQNVETMVRWRTEKPFVPFPKKQRRPNLIWIMADDLGYGELGCYGQQVIQTPNIDRMAGEGMKFTHFYAGATVCAPSRSVLMTGLHHGHTRVRGNAGQNNPRAQALRHEDVTVASVLKDAGYATALIGKWGLGDEGEAESGLPRKQGFDTFFGYLNQHHAHNHYPDFLWRNEERVALPNDNVPVGGSGGGYATKPKIYADDLFAEEAVQFVKTHRDEPFFLYWSMVIPHANNERRGKLQDGTEVPSLGAYADKDWPAPDKGQAAMVSRMDEYVGRMLNELKQSGLDKNTLVIFTSDNGPHNESNHTLDRFKPSGPYSGIKRSLKDGGIRVPFIAWWPGHVPAGNDAEHVGYFGDWMATAAQLAEGNVPAENDSISIVPTLLGRPDKQATHEFLYWEFHENGFHQAALYQGRWKGIRAGGPETPLAVYDLKNDSAEKTDVSSRETEITEKIDKYLRTARKESSDWPIKLPNKSKK